VALERAQRDLGQARRDLEAARAAPAAAYAMGTRRPCDGCHSARAVAIAAAEAAIVEAEARIADAGRRMGICEAAADILDSLAERLARVGRSRCSTPGPGEPVTRGRAAACQTHLALALADLTLGIGQRLARAQAQLRTVPQDLGEVYELFYEFARPSCQQLPSMTWHARQARPARWCTCRWTFPVAHLGAGHTGISPFQMKTALRVAMIARSTGSPGP